MSFYTYLSCKLETLLCSSSQNVENLLKKSLKAGMIIHLPLAECDILRPIDPFDEAGIMHNNQNDFLLCEGNDSGTVTAFESTTKREDFLKRTN